MALSESAVSELLDVLRTGQAVDLIRESVRMVLQELIEAEATDVVGAARYERTDTRTNERNGSRPRTLSTQAGDIDLRIPKLRKGSFFPLIVDRPGRHAGSTRRCTRWSWRPTSPAGPRSGARIPLERVNKEIKRRARVVGIFPNDAAVIRLVGAILTDMHDEWQSGEHRYLSEGSMAQLKPTSDTGGIAAIDSGE